MSISSSTDFTVSRDEIVTEALELLAILGEGESPSSDQLISSSRTLNSMLKAWQADGLNLFAVQRLFLFPKKEQREYSIGTGSTDNVTSEYTETAVASDSTGTTVEVDDATGMSVGDNIGIEIADDVVHWTTIATGGISGTTITIDDSLPSTASEDNVVYFYTTRAKRPMKLLEAYYREEAGDNITDIPVEVIARMRYFDLANKTATGRPNQIYFDAQIGAANVSVWPVADRETKPLVLLVQKTLADLDSSTDNPEYPQEWYLAIAYNLAMLLMPKYGTPPSDGRRIEQYAQFYYEMAFGFDRESETSTFFSPDTHWM